MWQAMNAVLIAVGISPEDQGLVNRIDEEVVGKGVLSKDAYQLLLDAQSAMARVIHGVGETDPAQAMQLLGRADQFISLTRTAVRERIGREQPVRRTEGVVGGDARIRNTRIPVWTLVQLKELGRTDAQLLDDFPGLTADDLRAAWDYYREHTDEIQQAITAEAEED
jgi:uncharacterized protein (DUF433 family)